ncbi:LysM peptidoglycan-binding domain-containing protein [Luteimonas sp. MC1572]|uniref:LysM peptidoglycan-binding domain-containing protein n=1 Tax=Luteimonas sp. MC1572 TaxID=2799325 RepID=UPI0018F0E12A|nr:LysM peptidoglycan-binding domain-containing protein [Luteimonas sp. MC1572]MBJ6981904.1 LysM peptidoglycan-binding domain-containing protein [Luteimonas sp. MC1572]QQO03181.1 LysM peptidoglycan-binding domain-containing protein [Luteimonas sp. MC1572]
MSNPQNPNDPASLSLQSDRKAETGNKPGKADFSNVRSAVDSTEAAAPRGADFGNVQSSVSSTEDMAGATSYTVQKGDTLSHIAKAQYGKASQWRRIFDANRDQLDDPDRIQPGQVLKIPPAEADS